MIILELGAPPTLPLSLNRERSMHWAARNRRLHPWRDLAWATATKAGVRGRLREAPCLVTVHIPVPDDRRRDPANYYPVVKAVVDGLVMAHCWPDDTPEFVTVTEPVLTRHKDAFVYLLPRAETAA